MQQRQCHDQQPSSVTWKELLEASRKRRGTLLASLLRPGLKNYKRKAHQYAFSVEGVGENQRKSRRRKLQLRKGLSRAIPRCIIHFDPLPPESAKTPLKQKSLGGDSHLTHITPMEGIPEKWLAMEKRQSAEMLSFSPVEGVLERFVAQIQSPMPKLQQRNCRLSDIEGVPERLDMFVRGDESETTARFPESVGSTSFPPPVMARSHNGDTELSRIDSERQRCLQVSESTVTVNDLSLYPLPSRHSLDNASQEPARIQTIPSSVVSISSQPQSAIDHRSTTAPDTPRDPQPTIDADLELLSIDEPEPMPPIDADLEPMVGVDREPELDIDIDLDPMVQPHEDPVPAPETIPRSSLLGSDVGTRWINGCRRSTRNRCKPLRWWDGEHKIYGRTHNTLATVTGYVTKSPKPEWPRPSPKASRTKRRR